MLSPRSPSVVTAESELASLATPIVSRMDEDADLVAGLKRGEERAFVALVRRYQPPLLRLAIVYCRSLAVAEEIVQDTWLGVIRGIGRFEERAAFKTWLFQILVNRARTRAAQEGRAGSWATPEEEAEARSEPSVPPERFRGADDKWANNWAVPPHSWGESPEVRLLAGETMDLVKRAISTLPPAQQQVITLRDVEGWPAEDVCNVLMISQTNQRVLLHRARSRVRAVLETHFK